MNSKKCIMGFIFIVIATSLSVIIGVKSIAAKQPDIKQFKLSDKSVTLYVNQTKTLTANADVRIIWKSSNKKIARVNKKGRIKGVSKGNAVITAIASRNKAVRAKCKVKVIKFCEKEAAEKADFIRKDTAILQDSIGSEWIIIDSKKQMKKFLDILKQNNIDLYNKYCNYDEEYFRKNYIVLHEEYINPYDSIEKIDSRIIQTDTGNIKLCINMDVSNSLPENEMGITVIYRCLFIQSISRKEACSIDEIEVSYIRQRLLE